SRWPSGHEVLSFEAAVLLLIGDASHTALTAACSAAPPSLLTGVAVTNASITASTLLESETGSVPASWSSESSPLSHNDAYGRRGPAPRASSVASQPISTRPPAATFTTAPGTGVRSGTFVIDGNRLSSSCTSSVPSAALCATTRAG